MRGQRPKRKQVKLMKHSLKSTQEQPTRQINWPRTVLAALVAALVTLIVLIRGKSIRYNQREINKRYVNPLMLKFAGRRSHGIRNEITSRNEHERKKHNMVIYDNM